ncbi:hypothetical protein JCM1393_22840 [Clostridium carnis]
MFNNKEQSIEETFNEILAFNEEEAFKYCKEGYNETNDPEYLLYMGHGHLVFGEYEDAIECVDRALIEGCDYYVYAYNVKGEALLELGLYIESRRCFERALEIEEDQFLSTTFLVELDIREEFYEEAINRCINYINIYGKDKDEIGELKSIIGWTYLVDIRNKEKAEKYFKEAIENTEICSRAYTGLGIYYVGEKNFKEAIKLFEKAIEIDDTDGENFFGLAICYKELREFDSVEDYLIKADSLEPGDTRILMELGFELLRQEKIEIAKEYFKEILFINPEAEDIRNLLKDI